MKGLRGSRPSAIYEISFTYQGRVACSPSWFALMCVCSGQRPLDLGVWGILSVMALPLALHQ